MRRCWRRGNAPIPTIPTASRTPQSSGEQGWPWSPWASWRGSSRVPSRWKENCGGWEPSSNPSRTRRMGPSPANSIGKTVPMTSGSRCTIPAKQPSASSNWPCWKSSWRRAAARSSSSKRWSSLNSSTSTTTTSITTTTMARAQRRNSRPAGSGSPPTRCCTSSDCGGTRKWKTSNPITGRCWPRPNFCRSSTSSEKNWARKRNAAIPGALAVPPVTAIAAAKRLARSTSGDKLTLSIGWCTTTGFGWQLPS
mmetsp:Transcript_27732/g.59274  ORF Transcript_27732/g.59274 Transcript_27732/m.59274 type:complete len:252 (+) Transcript_27732:818-1573(+)